MAHLFAASGEGFLSAVFGLMQRIKAEAQSLIEPRFVAGLRCQGKRCSVVSLR